jgi:hypothetical protein
MKIYKYLFYSLLAGIALVSASCDDPINFPLSSTDPYLVVDGTIDNDTTLPDTIRLSTTIGYLENRPLPPVTGASLLIFSTTGERDRLTEVRPGRYITDSINTLPGQTYTLEISTIEGEQYQASGRMGRIPTIDSIKARFVPDGQLQDEGWYIQFFTQEPRGRGDYYKFDLIRNDSAQTLPNDLAFASDELVDGNYINGPDLNNQPYKAGDRVQGSIRTITEDAFFFYNELAGAIFNGGLFASPPANLRTNVRNLNAASKKRATGYFFVTGLAYDTLVVPIRP